MFLGCRDRAVSLAFAELGLFVFYAPDGVGSGDGNHYSLRIPLASNAQHISDFQLLHSTQVDVLVLLRRPVLMRRHMIHAFRKVLSSGRVSDLLIRSAI